MSGTPALRPDATAARSDRPWLLVTVLTAIYAYAFMDRVILGLLVDPIKSDLHLHDEQMGLLLGIAFAALYALANLPAGYLVDRFDRRALIGAASVAWGAMTVLCALAGGFGQLFLGRAGVGLSEAVIGPAAFSLIRDGVGERARGTAFSIYAMAPLIGGGAALIGGGALLHAAKAGGLAGLGLPPGATPWRLVLGLAGILGLPVSLLLLALREPARQSQHQAGGSTLGVAGAATGGIGEALRHMRRYGAVYGPLIGYVTFGAMMSFGQSAWLPATLSRAWKVPPDRLGPVLGALVLTCGLAGLLLTAWLLRQMAQAGRDIRNFGALAALGTATGLAGAALAPSYAAALACAGFGLFFVGASYPIGAATLSHITPARLMGRVAAAYLLGQTLLGQALGPLLIATSATRLFNGADGLPRGFALSMAVFGLAATACAIVLRRRLAGGATIDDSLAVAGKAG